MNTARQSEQSWKTPILLALGLSFAALLAAPVFTSAPVQAPAATELFQPYRAASDTASPANQLLAQARTDASIETFR